MLYKVKYLIGDDIYGYILIVLLFEDYLGKVIVEEFLIVNIDLKNFWEKI